MEIEVRSDHVIIDGYVNAAGRDSRPIRCQTGDFVEQVEPGAFRKAIARAKNIDLLLNHQNDRKLGSTSEGNLILTEDNIGLRAHAVVYDPEVIQKARNNQLTGWSFGMYVNESVMEQRSNAIPRRHLKDFDIFEVTITDTTRLPCYAGTLLECRAEGEDVLAETRSVEDKAEKVSVTADYFAPYEKRLAQLRAKCQWSEAEKKLAELRYNPYHDPTTGRFTGSNGAGGGMLFVGKGQKGKGMYVVDGKEFSNNKLTIDSTSNEKFNKDSAEILRESKRLPNHYKNSLERGDIDNDEYNESMSELLTNVKENQYFSVMSSDGKTASIKGTTFAYKNGQYGLWNSADVNYITDLKSGITCHVKKTYGFLSTDSLSRSIGKTADTISSLIKSRLRAEPIPNDDFG